MLNIKDLAGIHADGVNDDYAVIMAALDNIAAAMPAGRNAVVNVGDGDYYLSQGIPLFANLSLISSCRRGARFKVGGGKPALFTAKYTNGAFVENLDATVNEIATKSRSAQNFEVSGLSIDYQGSLAPSYSAVVQLCGAFDSELNNIRVDQLNPNVDAISARLAWRIKLRNPVVSRGGSTGGRGISIDEVCNNFYLENPSALGVWSEGIAVDCSDDVINGGLIVNPNIEGCDVGLLVTGNAVVVDGGYIENCKTDIALGIVNGGKAYKPRIVGTFHGTNSNSQYFCRLSNAAHFWLDPTFQPNPTYSHGLFKVEEQGMLDYCFYRNERLLIGDVNPLLSSSNSAVQIYSPYSPLALNRKGAGNSGDIINFFLDGTEEAYVTVSPTGAQMVNKP